MPESVNTHDPLSITVLQSYNDRHCAKTHKRVGNGWETESYANEVHWAVVAKKITDVKQFWRVLRKLSARTDVIIIRGALIGDDQPGFKMPPFVDRLKRNHKDRTPTFEEQARSWVALDFDDVIAPDGYNTDQKRQEYLQSLLPLCFQGVCCWWQWTSSYKVRGDAQRLRARQWYLLDHPLNAAELDGLFRGYPVDRTVFRTVSANYIAHPRFIGAEDPVTTRYGELKPRAFQGGYIHAVPIANGIDEIRAAAREIKREHVVTAEEATATPKQLEHAIARVSQQDADAGNRHYSALGIAGEMVGLGCPRDLLANTLDDFFVHNGREAVPGEIDGIIETAYQYLEEGTLRKGSNALDALDDIVDTQEHPNGEMEDEYEAFAVSNQRRQMHYVPDNPRLNARAYLNRNHAFGEHYLYWGGSDFECLDGCWQRMMDSEVLVSRLVKDSPLSVGKCENIAKQIRMDQKREYLNAGSWLDAPKRISRSVLVFKNGRVDWIDYFTFGPDECLQENDYKLFQPSVMPYNYKPNAECPRWLDFINDQWPDDPETMKELQKYIGYLLSGSTRHQKIGMFVGATGGGKGVMATIINRLVGSENTMAGQIHAFTDKYFTSSMVDKKILFINEINEPSARKIPSQAIDAIKAISGCDEMVIRGMRAQPVKAVLPTRIIMICNEIPAFVDNSGAFRQRLLPFFFTKSFRNTKREDPLLVERLTMELPGIARWALDGLGYLENGEKLRPPASSKKILDILKDSTTPLASFIDSCFNKVPPEASRISCGHLYDMYRDWSETENHSDPLPRNVFFRSLRTTYAHVEVHQKRETEGRARYVYGLELTAEGKHWLGRTSDLEVDN